LREGYAPPLDFEKCIFGGYFHRGMPFFCIFIEEIEKNDNLSPPPYFKKEILPPKIFVKCRH